LKPKRSRTNQDYTIQLRIAIARFLPAKGLALSGARWCPRMLVINIVLMVFSSCPSLEQRFAEARFSLVNMYPSRLRPGKTYAGFIRMLLRHSAALLSLVTDCLRKHVERTAGSHWKVGGRLAFGVDGTKIDSKRTSANEQMLKIGGKNKSGPQQLLVVLMHVGTGLIWSFKRACATASERGLLLDQLELLPQACLLLADAGFTGYDLISRILAGKRDLLLRAGANVTLLTDLLAESGCKVRFKEGLVYLWPCRWQNQEPLILRQIVLVDGRNRRMCLLTNLSEQELTMQEACELYEKRWGVELLYRGLKQTLGRRKMHSSSPEHAQVELDWTISGYWMLGLMLWENRCQDVPVTSGMAFAVKLVRRCMAGRGDGRGTWSCSWSKLRVDESRRQSSKKARAWPHKKKDRPCGVPKLRMATAAEVQQAKTVMMKKQAA